MVVMTIIAMLMVISVSGIAVSNRINILNGEAEKVLYTIRDAQNKSISSVEVETAPKSTKAWSASVAFASKTLELANLYLDGGEIKRNSQNSETLNVGSVQIWRDDPGNPEQHVVGDIYLTFSAPFAKMYATTAPCTSEYNPYCGWRESSALPYDYALTGEQDANYFAPNRKYVVIKLNSGIFSKRIVILANGDSYIE